MLVENPRIREFAALVGEICSRTLVAPGKSLRRLLVINPRAGGFTIESRWKQSRSILEDYAKKVRVNPLRDGSGPAILPPSAVPAEPGSVSAGTEAGLVLTAGPGDAEAALKSLLDRAAREGGEDFFLIVAAGGDGTSRELQTALYHAPEKLRERFVILRLPLGTGNDGADSPDLDRALDLLIRPVEVTRARALRLLIPGRGPFLAFNVLSVGLDAFVTHMTNKMKGKLPGDSYKLWVDIAALFYDRIYTVGPLDVRVLDEEGREVPGGKFRRDILLLAVGAGGMRTYGSGKRILPDGRNVCALNQMSLWRKLALKELFNDGTHVDKPEAALFNASRVEFSGQYPILAQMDGETVLLQPEDFPAAIELSPPVIPVLRLKL
jgi:diacylglycerol kinase family enzyme